VPAGGDGRHAGADGAGTAHIERRIADHPDVPEVDGGAQVRADCRQGLASHVVPLVVLVADRPFLFVLHDRPTGAVFFAGQVTNPGASS